MSELQATCESLREKIAATEAQLQNLKLELQRAEEAFTKDAKDGSQSRDGANYTRKWPLDPDEYQRYGRQMIVPQIGLQGQLKLRASSVLIIGTGGLGCPAAMYLAGAGVGTIGLVDGDTVEPSNLHRQVLHRSVNVGKFKVDSAIEYLRELNPHPKYRPYRTHLNAQEAPDIFAPYDLVLDCTDNPASRYLISDAALVLGKPLVSAAALRTEGQLMVLNNPPRPPGDETGGPCYRCVFPTPPPADSVLSCADGGILGPVVGIMGVLQALEAVKVLTAPTSSPSGGTDPSASTHTPSLQLFSAYSAPQFRSIRLRHRRAKCAACSAHASISLDSLRSGSTDYVFFCGSASPQAQLRPEERISPSEYHGKAQATEKSTIIDVRDKVQFGICSLDNSINIPLSTILAASSSDDASAPVSNGDGPSPDQEANTLKPMPWWVSQHLIRDPESKDPIYVVCRLGNDSQIAVRKMKELGLDRGGLRFVGDIRGGLKGWKEEVDADWPDY